MSTDHPSTSSRCITRMLFEVEEVETSCETTLSDRGVAGDSKVVERELYTFGKHSECLYKATSANLVTGEKFREYILSLKIRKSMEYILSIGFTRVLSGLTGIGGEYPLFPVSTSRNNEGI